MIDMLNAEMLVLSAFFPLLQDADDQDNPGAEVNFYIKDRINTMLSCVDSL